MPGPILRFGDATLDIAARELHRRGARIELPPIVFDCIAYLVTHRERAVGRDELVAAVWGKAAISDTMLGKAILAARRAVGDTADAQAYLRTVPRFGYRWVAAVHESERIVAAPDDGTDARARTAASDADTAATPTPASPPAADTRHASPRAADARPASPRAADAPRAPASPTHGRRALVAVAIALATIALAVVLAALFVSGARAPSRSASAPVEPGALAAVLPVEVLADTGDDWLRLGLMDLIATRLRDAGIAVASSDSIVRVVPAGTPPERAVAAVGAAMDVGTWVLPAVRRQGDEWIARAELRHAGSVRVAQAHARSPVAAADALAQSLVALLGKAAPRPRVSAGIGVTELLQRTDAARLADDLDTARALIADAPAPLRALPDVRERGIRIALRAGEFEQARLASEALAAELPAETEPVMHARVLEDLCVAHMRLGRFDDAGRACDRAIALLEARDDAPLALGRTYSDRGVLHSRSGRHDEALADFARARVALTLAGDPLLLAQLDGNESTVQMLDGHAAEALPILERAGRTFQRFGMQNEFLTAVVNEVDANLILLRSRAALQASDAGWEQRTRIADAQVRHAFALARAAALAANGRLGEARIVLDGLLHDTEPVPAPAMAALARQALAAIELAGGDDAAAAMLARQSLDALTAPDDAHARADAWLTLVRALRGQGDGAAADAETARLRAWAATTTDPRVTVPARLADAEHAAAARDDTGAMRACDDAVRVATALGSADTLREATAFCSAYLIARGQLDRAIVVAAPLARYASDDYESALAQTRLYQALGQRAAWEAALAQARRLAGERRIPDALARPPGTGAELGRAGG